MEGEQDIIITRDTHAYSVEPGAVYIIYNS